MALNFLEGIACKTGEDSVLLPQDLSWQYAEALPLNFYIHLPVSVCVTKVSPVSTSLSFRSKACDYRQLKIVAFQDVRATFL